MTIFSLAGKVALVTGARQGIGETLSLAFAEAGADLALCDLVDDGKLEAVAGKIQAMGRRTMTVSRVDTSRKEDVERMAQKVVDQYGRIDILLNNAGIILKSPILDLAEKDWDRLFAVDLKGYFLCAQAVGRRMIEQKKGVIINLASQWAYKTAPGFGAYSIAKAGVVMLTRVLAREWGQFGIRTNTLAPAMVITDFSKDTWSNPAVLKQIGASLPLGRAAETKDLVGAALLLASDASSYITGHTLVLDGGALA